MKPRLGVSGSTILSDVNQLEKLFWEGIGHIEIGEFADEAALERFLELKERHAVTFGVHAPLFRHQSKNDLLEAVQFDPAAAWEQLEQTAERLSSLGAEYILVHFPYFKGEQPSGNADALIQSGVKKLETIQRAYSLPIICEPKLGLNKSPVGIQSFHHTPLEWWESLGGICIDIGDFQIAAGDAMMEVLAKWKPLVKVVHLHHVHHEPNGKYWWIPVHPSHEQDRIHEPLQDVIVFLSDAPDVTFIFEHTPHSQPTDEFVQEGVEWIKQLTQNNPIPYMKEPGCRS
jgi:sugar phosphate isomerase/epimerase